jgi:hypothetical protein
MHIFNMYMYSTPERMFRNSTEPILIRFLFVRLTRHIDFWFPTLTLYVLVLRVHFCTLQSTKRSVFVNIIFFLHIDRVSARLEKT